MSSRRLQDMSSRRLEGVFSITIFCLPIRLENVFKTSSRRHGSRKIVTMKTCWRRLQDMSWRCLQDILKTNKCLLEVFIKKYISKHSGWAKTRTLLNAFYCKNQRIPICLFAKSHTQDNVRCHILHKESWLFIWRWAVARSIPRNCRKRRKSEKWWKISQKSPNT